MCNPLGESGCPGFTKCPASSSQPVLTPLLPPVLVQMALSEIICWPFMLVLTHFLDYPRCPAVFCHPAPFLALNLPTLWGPGTLQAVEPSLSSCPWENRSYLENPTLRLSAPINQSTPQFLSAHTCVKGIF